MLAVIDPSGNGAISNTSPQLITLNFQRAVKAVATLAAGAAIPTVNAITQSNTSANAIILTNANTNMGLWYYVTGATSVPSTTGGVVFGTTGNLTISSVKTASYTATGATTTLTVSAVASGNIQPAMVLGGTAVVPNNYITAQLTVNATATPATLTTTYSGTSGESTITIASNTGIAAGQFIANTLGGATGITGLPQGTYVGAFYSNGVAYSGNTTVPLKSFGNGDIVLTSSAASNNVAFFTAGKTGTYSLFNSHTSGTINAGTVFGLSAPHAATSGLAANVVYFSTNNCIQSLISNTEAGGWSVSSETTASDSYSGANNTVGGALLDLYVQNTSKASYPYHKIAIRQNPSVAFSNATYSSFPYMYLYHGASVTNVYSDATFSAFTGPSAIVNQRTTPTAVSGFGALLAQTTDFPCILAVTANYMHIVQNNYVVSMGYRDTAGWEDGYSDNPPVYHFCTDTRVTTTSKNYPASSFMWARALNNTGSVTAAARYQYAYTAAAVATQPNPVTGVDMNDTVAAAHQAATLSAARVGFSGGPSAPIFYLTNHYSSATYIPSYPPGYDSANSTFVPSAYPCVMQLNRPGVYNAGGKANGIYKSLSTGGSMTMTSYYTPGATYTVGSDSYYPALTGLSYDLFLVRKA
jgi:hypothetical protein